MKRRSLMKAAALMAAMGIAAPAVAQDAEKKIIGVSIPSATHGFMGGLNWHAQDTIKRLGAAIPTLNSCSPPPATRPSRSTTSRT